VMKAVSCLLVVVSSIMFFGCSPENAGSTSDAANKVVSEPSNQSQAGSTNTSGSTTSPVWFEGMNLLVNPSRNDAFQLKSISTLSQPHHFHVVGEMRAFEAVGTGLLAVDGRPLPQGSASVDGIVTIHAAEGAPAWGDFQVDFQYPAELSGHYGVLEFYLNSPKDGSKQSVLEVQLLLP
jgi:hypothetical protein